MVGKKHICNVQRQSAARQCSLQQLAAGGKLQNNTDNAAEKIKLLMPDAYWSAHLSQG